MARLGDRLHVVQAGNANRPGVKPDDHRLAAGHMQRRRERLVMPGPGVVRPFDRGHVRGLSDHAPTAALPAGCSSSAP